MMFVREEGKVDHSVIRKGGLAGRGVIRGGCIIRAEKKKTPFPRRPLIAEGTTSSSLGHSGVLGKEKAVSSTMRGGMVETNPKKTPGLVVIAMGGKWRRFASGNKL